MCLQPLRTSIELEPQTITLGRPNPDIHILCTIVCCHRSTNTFAQASLRLREYVPSRVTPSMRNIAQGTIRPPTLILLLSQGSNHKRIQRTRLPSRLPCAVRTHDARDEEGITDFPCSTCAGRVSRGRLCSLWCTCDVFDFVGCC